MAQYTYNPIMSQEKEIVKKFSQRLKELRIKKGMTQEDLAETADIS